ncbi:MAG: hypothetical protein V1858_00140 [Candidatus Gottesmanbacteria bacterium]
MENQKLKKILSITLAIVILFLVTEGLWLFKESRKSSLKTTNLGTTITKLGKVEEFTLGRDGTNFYENTATSSPKIEYRISSPGKVTLGHWQDLKVGDKVNLTTTYEKGKVKEKFLYIYRQ